MSPRDALLILFAEARVEVPASDFDPAGPAQLEEALALAAAALEQVVGRLAAEQEGGIPDPIGGRAILRDAVVGLMVAYATSGWVACEDPVVRA